MSCPRCATVSDEVMGAAVRANNAETFYHQLRERMRKAGDESRQKADRLALRDAVVRAVPDNGRK